MKLLRTVKLYRSLTPPQKQILRDKGIDLTMTPEGWLGFLNQLARFDKEGDALRKVCGWSAGIGLGFALLSAFFLLPAGMEADGAVGLVLKAVPAVLLVVGIAGLVGYLVVRRYDLANNLRQFVVPLIAVLREEMKPQDKLALTMDFRGGTLKEKQVDHSEHDPGRFRYPKIKETHYRDPWLAGNARLADGGVFAWQIEDRIRKREITKKTPRGKIKTKTKHKIKRCMSVRLGLGSKAYGLEPKPGIVDASEVQLAVREGEKRNLFKLSRVVVHDDLGAVLDLNVFLDLVATAYRQVSLAARS